jgi:hypothetical protein
MRHPAFIVATLTGSLLFGASVAGALRAPLAGITGGTIGAKSVEASPSPAAAKAASARAQAALLVAAIKDQFPGHAVDVALAAPTLADDGPSQQQMQALARVRIDGSAPMPVRASALYDRETRSIATPSLWFEGTGEQPASGTMRRDLAAAATRRLDAEFAGQPLSLALLDAEAVAVGGRYLRVVARGTTDFGDEGRAATTIEALYDPRNGEWLRLDYALGADPAQAGDGIAYAAP